MSFVYALLFLLVLGGACFGSWKAALYWHNRTRDARSEDPRDQEIRELSAALSIARKNLEKLDNRTGSSAHEVAVLQDQIKITAAALAESQEKIAAANAAVSREIETREALDARLAQMIKDLDAAKGRVAELEVQVKIVSPSSGLVAGLDDVLEDDEKEVFTIRHEHKVYKQQVAELEQAVTAEKAESARWKQHCSVLGTTNKTLRQRTDSLAEQLVGLDDLKAKAAQLLVATADNQALQRDVASLRQVAAEVPALKVRIAELNGVEQDNATLRQQLNELAGVHATNAELRQQLADFETTKATLQDAQQNIHQLQAELAELVNVRQANSDLHARIDALAVIETDNEALKALNRSLQAAHTEELGRARAEIEQLQVRVAALDQIQEENTQLLKQSRELKIAQARIGELQTQLAGLETVTAEREALELQLQELQPLAGQLAAAQDGNKDLQAQVAAAHADHARATEKRLLLEETVLELQSAQAEQGRLHTEELAQLRGALDKLQAEAQGLRTTSATLEAAAQGAQEQLHDAHCLQAATSAQANELRITYETLRDRLVQLERDRSDSEALLQAASDELAAAQLLNQQLMAQLAERNHPAAQSAEHAEAPVSLPTEPTAEKSSGSEQADTDSNTDSLPVLKIPSVSDDLKSIRGVGAKLEQKLNMLGVFNFRDLVELEESDFARAAQLIPDLANRIERDNWMQQARELHRHKYNETL